MKRKFYYLHCKLRICHYFSRKSYLHLNEKLDNVPALSAAEVSESSGDEGGNDLDKGKPEKDEPQKGDYRVNPEDVPDLEDESEEEDEFTQIWGKLGLQPDKGQIAIVKENWRKIKGRIEVIWQDLRQVIIDAFKE